MYYTLAIADICTYQNQNVYLGAWWNSTYKYDIMYYYSVKRNVTIQILQKNYRYSYLYLGTYVVFQETNN